MCGGGGGQTCQRITEYSVIRDTAEEAWEPSLQGGSGRASQGRRKRVDLGACTETSQEKRGKGILGSEEPTCQGTCA